MTLWRPDTPIRPPLVTSLVVRHSADPVRVVALTEPELTIGRTNASMLAIRSGAINKHHAKLVWTPNGLVLEDRSSTNGTYVGGRKITRHLLHVGDKFFIGPAMLSFEYTVPAIAVPTTEAKLLAAIRAEPDDDDPRLVLADYLTDRGDPRGEYIAYELAAQSSVNTEARARAEALLARHELDWIAPLPVPVASWEFRRGLLDCVWIREGIDPTPLYEHHPLRVVLAAD
jgi:uncharacterized protein (TIGR02996 family)